MTLFCYTAYF